MPPRLCERMAFRLPSSIPCCKTPSLAFRRRLQQHRRIVAIYEDDFNFLSKMCLTRMRELAWQMLDGARHCGSHRRSLTDRTPPTTPKSICRHGADFVLVGEAEQTSGGTVCSILARRRAAPATIAGLVTSIRGQRLLKARVKSPETRIGKILPKPARELIDLEPYREAWISAHGYFSTNVVASRGCPYRCNWCAKPISGDKFQLRPRKLSRKKFLS